MAEVPGLRPIETPREIKGDVFFSPSPKQRSPYSSSSSNDWQATTGGEEATDVGSDGAHVVGLPQHRRGATGATTAAGNGRFRTILTSPFRSPSPKGVAKFSYDDDENILNMPARREFHAVASPRRAQTDPTFKVVVSATLLLCGFCLYLVWPYLSLALSPGFTFAFRPPPPLDSPYEVAAKRFRRAYQTTKGGIVGFNDPLNPGSIFVVLDKVPEERGAYKGKANVDDYNNFINPKSGVFKLTRKFAMGMEPFLLGGGHDNDDPAHKFIDVTSFYSVLTDNLPHIAGNQYATHDGLTTLIEVKFAVPSKIVGTDLDEYIQHVVDSVKDYVFHNVPHGIKVGYTGLPLFRSDLRSVAYGKKVKASEPTMSLNDMLLPTAPSMVAYRRLADRFGWGIVSPYKIVFDAKDASMDTDPGFRLMHRVMRAFATGVDPKVETEEEKGEEERETVDGVAAVNLDSIPQRIEDGHMDEHLAEVMDDLYGKRYMAAEEIAHHEKFGHGHLASKAPSRTVYNGIPFLRNNEVPYPLYLGARICREKQKQHCTIELLHYLTAMTDVMTSKDRTVTYVSATLGVDPFAADGIAWLMAARDKLTELKEKGTLDGYKVTILGGLSLEYDALQRGESAKRPPPPSIEPTYILLGSALLLFFIFAVRFSLLNQGDRSIGFEHKEF